MSRHVQLRLVVALRLADAGYGLLVHCEAHLVGRRLVGPAQELAKHRLLAFDPAHNKMQK